MKFKEGGYEHLADILRHGEEFWTHTLYYRKGRKYSKNGAAKLCANLIESPIGFIVVMLDDANVCKGFGMAAVTPFIFDPTFTSGLEIAYYIAPEHRGKYGVRLLQEMEKTAKKYGADFMSMVTMEDSSPEVAARVYTKLGYEKNEVVYTKEL